MKLKMNPLAAAVLAVGIAALAAPLSASVVQIGYGSIVATTTEDFQSQPLGHTATNPFAFDGFTYSAPRPSIVSNSTFCDAAGDKCLVDGTFEFATPRVLSGFSAGTTAVGFDLTKIGSSDAIIATVLGTSGSQSFALSSPGLFGFQDLTGLISISIVNNGFGGANSNYGLDDVITNATVIPLPAALPLLGAGLALLGMIGRRRRDT